MASSFRKARLAPGHQHPVIRTPVTGIGDFLKKNCRKLIGSK
jgi:hypothetical protein